MGTIKKEINGKVVDLTKLEGLPLEVWSYKDFPNTESENIKLTEQKSKELKTNDTKLDNMKLFGGDEEC